MKTYILTLALMFGAADPAGAKVYFINQGVKYHIGDARFSRSLDKDFLGAYPVVGQEWIQAFSVDRPDRVKVRIEHVWGVDDCDYCKDLVSIDESLMGRLYSRDNGSGFETLEPLAKPMVPGKIYYLKIESVGLQADDFVIQNVIVETDKAELTLMEPGPVIKNPGEPMPKIYPPAPRARASTPCDGLAVNHNWMLGWSKGAAVALSFSTEGAFEASPPVVELALGQAADIDMELSRIAGQDAVGQPLECLVGSSAFDGWAMLFSRTQDRFEHGNLIQGGDYTGLAFSLQGYAGGLPHRLRVEHCRDGMLQLLIDGHQASRGLRCAGPTALISFRAQNMDLTLKSATAPEAEAPQGLPAAPALEEAK